jgi:hypothetical protein
MGLRKRFQDAARDAAKLVQRQDGTGGKYEFESRVDRMSRRLKGILRPCEERDDMREFIESRDGLEVYVEAKTVMHPLSAVLVAGDGGHRRFTLLDDAYLRQLARENVLPIFDAGRIAYPQRMREYAKRRRSEPGS